MTSEMSETFSNDVRLAIKNYDALTFPFSCFVGRNLTENYFMSSWTSDSQSLLSGPLVVRETSSSGPLIPNQINLLCFSEH